MVGHVPPQTVTSKFVKVTAQVVITSVHLNGEILIIGSQAAHGVSVGHYAMATHFLLLFSQDLLLLSSFLAKSSLGLRSC